MAIIFGDAGAHTLATAAVTAINPVTPPDIWPGDISILTVQIKATTAGVAPTITTPAGWTLIGISNNGTLVGGVDTGSNTVAMYYKISAVASLAVGNIAMTGANSAGAVINSYRSDKGELWDITTTTGSDTTSGANASITGAAGINVAAGDWVLVSAGVSGDIGTLSSQAISGMSGATRGTVVARKNSGVTTGNDSRTLVYDAPITAGSSNAAPTFTYSNASAQTSHARFVRLRERVAGVHFDDFERANATGIENIGNDWIPANADGNANIVSGNLVKTDAYYYQAIINPGGNDLPADYTITAILPDITGSYFGIFGRWLANAGVSVFFDDRNNLIVHNAVGYTAQPSVLPTTTYPASWSTDGIDHTIAAKFVSDTVEVWLDGSLAATVTGLTINNTVVGTGYGICGEGQNRAWKSIGVAPITEFPFSGWGMAM